jgi:hypothetical protein
VLRRPRMRSSCLVPISQNSPRLRGIPRLERGSVLFLVGEARVTVMRVGYLGKDIWSGIPNVADPGLE